MAEREIEISMQNIKDFLIEEKILKKEGANV